MRQRCGHFGGGHATDIKRYAERGIVVCAEWRGNFATFRDWALANGYADSLLLDRRENDDGYSPSNCRWVTVTVSNRNKSSTLGEDGAKETLRLKREGIKSKDIALRLNVSVETVYNVVSGRTYGQEL